MIKQKKQLIGAPASERGCGYGCGCGVARLQLVKPQHSLSCTAHLPALAEPTAVTGDIVIVKEAEFQHSPIPAAR
jgi:hypothetical protein